jgi:uncharacterized membrane protein YoaK (UPF0700 family)
VAIAGLVALSVAGIGATNVPHPPVIAIVALAMGMRSMAALRAAIPGMPTQMIQGSLVAVIDRFISRDAGHQPRPEDAKLTLTRHAATIGGTVVGAVLGALLVAAGAGVALLAVAAAVLVTAGVYALVPRYRPPTTPTPQSLG